MIKARRCNLISQQIVDQNYSELFVRGAIVKGDANMIESQITEVQKKRDGDLVSVSITQF